MRGGLAGALAPFLLFLAGVAWLAVAGAPDERGFWPVLLAAIALGMALATDRTRYAEVLIAGMAQPLVMLMVMAWLLAGVLSTLMSSGGLVQALVWGTAQLGLAGGGYTAAAFAAAALVAVSTGTSFGTILICGPLLYPAGAASGADPVWLAGAILAGATFGDSISPISDTTIASSGTQGADIGGTVRARLKYVVPAGAVTMVAYAMLGGAEATAATAAVAAGEARGWPLALVPVLIVSMLLARRHLVEALLAGIVAAVAIAVPLGLIAPSQLLRVEPGSFSASSLVIDGLERGVGVSIFTLLLVGLVAGLEASGALTRLVGRVSDTPRARWITESRIVGTVMAAALVTTHSVVAILAVGDYARRAGVAAGIGAYRRANLLDLAVCTWPFLLPYFLPAILMSGATAAGAAVNFPRVSPLEAGMANLYSWLLLVMLAVAVGGGYGRDEGGARSNREAGG
jgi:Na+/H+ antiporter NhaC